MTDLGEEEIARAIHEAEFGKGSWHNNTGPITREQARVRARAVLALPRPPQSDGWQPIETRPAGFGACWIGHAPSRTMIVAYTILASDSDGEREHWRIMWSDRAISFTPTHWMPLPSPPETGRTEK